MAGKPREALQRRLRVLGGVTLQHLNRGLLAIDRSGNRMIIAWQPRGLALLSRLNEQCQCRLGWLRRLSLSGGALILGCDACRRIERYQGVGVAASSPARQVS